MLSCLIYNYSISGDFHRLAVGDLYCRTVWALALFAASFVGLMLARRGWGARSLTVREAADTPSAAGRRRSGGACGDRLVGAHRVGVASNGNLPI